LEDLNEATVPFYYRDKAFQYDSNKAVKNLDKHSITFEYGAEAFYDTAKIIFFDRKHSQAEERWKVIGKSTRDELLSVVYTKRGDSLRLISARRANEHETERYGERQQRP
jgi:uncharacterized DUF497 family protein